MNLLDFMYLLVDFGKVLFTSAKEVQKNPNASSKENVYSMSILCLAIDPPS